MRCQTAPRSEDKNKTVDGANPHLRALHPQPHQGICADMIATLDGYTREQIVHHAGFLVIFSVIGLIIGIGT